MNQYLFPIGILDQPQFDRMKQTLTALDASTVFIVPVSGNRLPFTPNESYRAFLTRLTEMAAQLTEIGIEPAVWIPTLGYGDKTNPENQPIAAELTHIQSIDGKTAEDAFCPADPRFAEIMCRIVADLARTGVRRIMLDDELVLSVRPGIGCACDRHMQQFRRRIGRDIDRASLENALFTGPGNALRRAWLDLMGGTLRTFCQQLRAAVEPLRALALGGTAVGTGLNAPAGFDSLSAERISALSGHKFVTAENKFHALTSRSELVFAHGALKALACDMMKIANDVRWLASGPRDGLGEIFIPENEPGSSIMPGKVNPTQCEQVTMTAVQVLGNDTAVGLAASQGNFELNVFLPVCIYNFLQSARLLAASIASFDERCVSGIRANRDKMAENMERSLMLVTALSPTIGYEAAAETAKLAHREDLTLREACLRLGYLTGEQFDALFHPEEMV